MDSVIIEKEAMLLPEGMRALLADRLLESISPVSASLREAWVMETDSRLEAYRNGRIHAVDGPAAMAELHARFAK